MKTVTISGPDEPQKRFSYEWGCQVILARGLRWLQRNAVEREVPERRESAILVGVSEPANSSAREMEKYAMDHEGLRACGATRAMVQFSLRHAIERFKRGDEAYFAEFADDPGRIFEFDEADAFPEESGVNVVPPPPSGPSVLETMHCLVCGNGLDQVPVLISDGDGGFKCESCGGFVPDPKVQAIVTAISKNRPQ